MKHGPFEEPSITNTRESTLCTFYDCMTRKELGGKRKELGGKRKELGGKRKYKYMQRDHQMARTYRRRISTEEKAKVVTSVWGK